MLSWLDQYRLLKRRVQVDTSDHFLISWGSTWENLSAKTGFHIERTRRKPLLKQSSFLSLPHGWQLPGFLYKEGSSSPSHLTCESNITCLLCLRPCVSDMSGLCAIYTFTFTPSRLKFYIFLSIHNFDFPIPLHEVPASSSLVLGHPAVLLFSLCLWMSAIIYRP